MNRYHMNPKTGNPNKCSAKQGNCPFKSEAGSEATHYASAGEARVGYEQEMEAKTQAARESKKLASRAIAPLNSDGTRNVNFFTESELDELEAMKSDSDGLVRIGEISNGFLGEQSQYISRYFDGEIERFPKLTDGLTYTGNSRNYHSYKLAKTDVQEFVIRLRTYRQGIGQNCR